MYECSSAGSLETALVAPASRWVLDMLQPISAHTSLIFVPVLGVVEMALALWSQDEVPITTLTPDIRVAGVNGSASKFMSFGLGTGIAKNC